jgi:hypothetical protein
MPRSSSVRPPVAWDGVLTILADGARPDVILALAAAGEMPSFKKHIIDRGGFRTAPGVFPTVSGPAHLPLLTGMHPGQANLPGIRWAERPTKARGSFLLRTRSYMSLGRAFRIERDIPPNVTTIFQHLPGVADVNTWFVRGCAARARMTRFSKAGAFLRSWTTSDWYSSDLQAERGVRRAWDRGYRSAFAVFPAIDELGHRFGPMCDASYEAYRRFDACLGRLVDELARRGRADRTLVAVSSDHGQTATHTHLDIDDLVRAVYPRTVAYPKIWRHLLSAQAAAMVSGNGMANLYIEGANGDWRQRPDFDAPGSRAVELRDRLVAHPGIEHVIYRRAGTPGDTFVVASASGRLVVAVEPLGPDAQADQAGDAGSTGTRAGSGVDLSDPWLTLTFDGGDPVGYGGVARRLRKSEVAAATAATGFPDLPAQLVDFFRARRAGDLVVCARQGFDLRSRFEYQPHLGSHGCLDREHILVPVGFNAELAEPSLRAVDVFPTILSALGAPPAPGRLGQAKTLRPRP